MKEERSIPVGLCQPRKKGTIFFHSSSKKQRKNTQLKHTTKRKSEQEKTTKRVTVKGAALKDSI
ncbi:unnamed protein product, partial [Vitis vinifera]|uniref:Uncharacterized protein n=1 Tax=Vitis vinifera TaxID=29760 RepID=E0CQ16_VITVI